MQEESLLLGQYLTTNMPEGLQILTMIFTNSIVSLKSCYNLINEQLRTTVLIFKWKEPKKK